jgi:hypothetical protein
LGIPVVFVTSYADDAIIEKAKAARPYGYIVKPFNELEIKAAIEIALFRRDGEPKQQKEKRPAQEEEEPEYLDLPGIKTVLLRDIFTDLILYLYTDQSATETAFRFAIEEGLKKGGRNFFAYHRSTIQRHFLPEIQNGNLVTRRIKKGELYTMIPLLQRCTATLPPAGKGGALQILFDFYETEEFGDIVGVKEFILAKKAEGLPVSGIIALNIGKIDHTLIRSFSEGIAKIIVSTGRDTMLSFAHRSFPAESVTTMRTRTVALVMGGSVHE